MTLVPRIDESACAAHGDCVEIAPGVFALDDVAVVIGAGPSDLLVEAARGCPSAAIAILETDTGETVYP